MTRLIAALAGALVVLSLQWAEAIDPKAGPPRGAGPELQSLTLNPATIVGGQAARGLVTMTGILPSGVTVNLSSPDRLRGLAFPATVPVHTAFWVTTPHVTSTTTVTIAAAYRGMTRSATLTILPTMISSVACPSSSYGGHTVTCRVDLNGPAPAGATAEIVVQPAGAATVPATMAFPHTTPGKPPIVMPYSYGTLTLTPTPVASATAFSLLVSYQGGAKKVTLKVMPPVLSSLTCPPSIVGGNSVNCQAMLISPAPKGGVDVNLSSGNAEIVKVPAAVHITKVTEGFTANTSAVATSTSVTISGSYGEKKSTVLEVKPVPLPDLRLYAFTFYDAQTGNGINGPVAGRAFRMCINVVNGGQAQAGSSTLLVDLYRSGAGKINTWTRGVSALAPGTGDNPCIDVGALDAGSTYDFYASADAGKAVAESHEDNNFGRYTRGL